MEGFSRTGQMRIHWQWVFLAYWSLFVFGLTDNIRGPLYPEISKHFDVSQSTGSLFFAVASFMNVVGAFFVPRLIHRVGHLGTLVLFMFVLMVTQLGFYFSPSFGLILFFCAFYGMAIGGLAVTQNLLVLVATPAEQRQQIQSGLHACYGASSFLAPGMVITCSIAGLSWKENFAFTSLIIFLFLASLYFVKHQPRQSQVDGQITAQTFVKRREMVYLAATLGIYVAVENLIASRLALFMRLEQGLDLKQSTFWVFVFFGGMFLGRTLLGFYRPPFTIASQLKLSLIGTSVLIVGGIFVRPEIMALTGFALAPFYPLMMTAMSLLFHEKMDRAAALAVALSGVAVVSMHAAVGFLSDLVGLNWAFLLGVGLSFVAFGMIILHKRYFGRAIP